VAPFNCRDWLSSLGLAQYADVFERNELDDRSIVDLSDEDLRMLGVGAMGHRKILIREAAKLGSRRPKSGLESGAVFLSYAHRSEREEDFDISEELVLLIKEELERDGHAVWIDREGIREGSQWRERITAAILERPHFLSFLSVRSVRDPGVCLNEIAIALGHGKNIQTVLAEDERRVAPPLTISHVQWHDFQHWREIRDGTRKGPLGEEWSAWFGQRMERVRDALRSARNSSTSGELQRLRGILTPDSFEARIVEKTTHFEGRAWLFDAAQNWLDNADSRMFWLKAGPGIGKSAFAAKLAHQARSAVIGFFMCDFQGKKDPEQSAREAVCTLAFQIASRLPDYRLKLIHQMQVDRDKIDRRSADDLFEFLITEPLNRSGKIPESTRLCLVIDGLDEAGRNDGRNMLADLLAKHVDRLPSWLGILVTSRPEPHLEQTLQTLSGTTIDGQGTRNREDLAEWVDRRLPKSLEGVARKKVIDAVLEKSGGTFLYLNLVSKDRSLDFADPAGLPDKLDGFFKQTFDRYFPDVDSYGRQVEPFLRLLSAAPEPLPAGLGMQLLGWSRRQFVLNVLEPMGSLLRHQESGLSPFHASLVEWLRDPVRSGRYCIDDGGERQLGDFIWRQFEAFDGSEWQAEVRRWLATTLRSTDRWSDAQSLDRAARFLDESRRYAESMEVRERQVEVTDASSSTSDFDRAEARRAHGHSLMVLGRYAEAERQFLAAMSLYGARHDSRELIAECLEETGFAVKELARLVEAEGHFRHALDIRNATADVDPEAIAGSVSNLGELLDARGEFEEVIPLYQSAFASLAKSRSPVGIRTAVLLNNAAILKLRLVGGLVHGPGIPPVLNAGAESARQLLSLAQSMSVKVFRDDAHPDSARFTNNLALCLQSMGRMDEAAVCLADALEKLEGCLGPDHASVATCLNNLAALGSILRPDPANEARYLRAITIFETVFGVDHPHVARCINNLAGEYVGRGDVAAARKLYSRAHGSFLAALGERHCDTLQTRSHLALLDFFDGDADRVGGELEAVFALRTAVLGRSHPQAALSGLHLGHHLRNRGAGRRGEEMMSLIGESRDRLREWSAPSTVPTVPAEGRSGREADLPIDDSVLSIATRAPATHRPSRANHSLRMQLTVVERGFVHPSVDLR